MESRRNPLSQIPENRKVCATCGDTFKSKLIRARHCSAACKYRASIGEAAWSQFQELVKTINATYAQSQSSAEFGARKTMADGKVVTLLARRLGRG